MALQGALRRVAAAWGGRYRMGNRQTASVGLSYGAAVNQIQGLNVNYTTVELDLNRNGKQFQDILEQMTGGRTVPRVFINGTCVGGATDAQKLHEEGKLLPLINQCQMRRNY
ncbi:glutaredoxin 2 isoform X3 [Agelaius tricolor]|uniref:glutaredoxin 2 isoform X3 n=1 Tax=Agelaius tricolor TaxID=9191 RepID=UPI0039F1DBCC